MSAAETKYQWGPTLGVGPPGPAAAPLTSGVLGEDVVEDPVGGELAHVAGQVLRVQRLELRLALVELLVVTLVGKVREEEHSEA